MPKLQEPGRITLYIPAALHAALRDISETRDMSMSEVARVALWEYIERTHPDVQVTIGTWVEWDDLWASRMYSLMEELKTTALKLASGDLPFDDDDEEEDDEEADTE